MTQRDKRHERIVNNPANVDFENITPWLYDFGFRLERIAGSHHIFRHSITKAKLNFQPERSGKAKAYQVKQAIKLSESLKLRSK
ncbi:MAG: type II toxin-antitoxin system HicA family toxin [Syntrophobacteraceae bacterium]